MKNSHTLLAAETREGKYVNASQPKTCAYFSNLAWRSGVRNLLRDFSFQHLRPAILNTSHPFSPHKIMLFSSRGWGSQLAKTQRARFLAGINHCGPPKKPH